jgi:hypothetical protein
MVNGSGHRYRQGMKRGKCKVCYNASQQKAWEKSALNRGGYSVRNRKHGRKGL